MHGEGGYISGHECNLFTCRLYTAHIANTKIALRCYQHV